MIKNIILDNFRNFDHLDVNVNNRLVIFVGKNAIGKTSILESIYLASTSKSHRTNNYQEMIKKNQNKAKILINADKCYEVVLDSVKKHYYINKREIRNVEFLGNLKTIMFSSQDLKIITGGKNEKRHFLDINLSLLDNRYLSWLVNYKKLLKKRNELLKETKQNLVLIKVISQEMANYVLNINKYRDLFCLRLNEYLKEITTSLNFEDIKINYNFITNIEKINLQYDLTLKNDLKYKVTNYGPHKDDFEIEIANNSVKQYASAGQQRTVVICLKLALAKILEKDTKNSPILLLDDVFAELDYKRQEALVKYLDKNQTFITTTSLIEIPNNLLEHALIIKLEERK